MKSIFVPMNGETGGSMGPNGKLQNRRIKAAIIKAFPCATVVFHSNHYCCSAMIKFSEDNIIYFSASDYRFFPQSFLVRTAKTMTDWTGGINNTFVGFEKILAAIEIIGKQRA